MRPYEAMFIVSEELCNEKWQDVEQHIRGLLVDVGAQINGFKKWDTRKLEYDIKGVSRGVYILANYLAPEDSNAPLMRRCELSDIVLRVLVVRDEETPEDDEEDGAGSEDAHIAKSPPVVAEGDADAAPATEPTATIAESVTVPATEPTVNVEEDAATASGTEPDPATGTDAEQER